MTVLFSCLCEALCNMDFEKCYINKDYYYYYLLCRTWFSKLDYCNSIHTGLPACVMRSLQMIQNAMARLVFDRLKRTHVTPLLVTLHWFPVAARITFTFLTHTYRTTTGSVPAYLNSMMKCYSRSRPLRVPQFGNQGYRE